MARAHTDPGSGAVIARLRSLAARVWRRIIPPVLPAAEFAAERAAASRAMAEATCLAVADPDATNEAEVLALFEAMVPQMRIPGPRKGGA